VSSFLTAHQHIIGTWTVVPILYTGSPFFALEIAHSYEGYEPYLTVS